MAVVVAVAVAALALALVVVVVVVALMDHRGGNIGHVVVPVTAVVGAVASCLSVLACCTLGLSHLNNTGNMGMFRV